MTDDDLAPMRVAIAHPMVWPEVRRGAERYADDLAWFLRGRGHDVDLVTGTTEGTRVEHRPDGTVVRRHHHLGLVKLAKVGIDPVQSFGMTIHRTLRAQRYDVVHAFVPSAAISARLAGVPSVLTFIGHPTLEQWAGRRFDLALHRAAARAVDLTTALSEASARSTASVVGRRPEVLPPGVRVDRFATDHPPSPGPDTLLFSAAADDRRKGLDLLLRALDRLLDDRPDLRLHVSGQGDPAWAFEHLGTGRSRVEAAVDLLGPGDPDELPRRYQRATLSVLPAVDEAFGLSVVESLASGTPVVCSDDAGMVDIVDHDAVGRTFRAGDVSDLVRAIREGLELARGPATPEACAHHARRWDWSETIGPVHEEHYRRIVRGRAPRRTRTR